MPCGITLGLKWGPFPSSVRGSLIWGHVGKSPHGSFLDGSVPLKANRLVPANSGAHCCPLAPASLLLPLVQQTTCPGCCGASPPPSPTGRFLGTKEWDGAPRKRKTAGASLRSEQSDVPKAAY